MNTQRINVYIAGSGINVFYIEQYNPELHEWFTVGNTYENVEHIQTIVENHNLKLVLDKLLSLKGSQ